MLWLTTDFSPIEDAGGTFSATQTDVFIKNGFIVFNATDTAGLVYVVTWEEFQTHQATEQQVACDRYCGIGTMYSVAVYVPSGRRSIYSVVKVFAGNDGNIILLLSRIST